MFRSISLTTYTTLLFRTLDQMSHLAKKSAAGRVRTEVSQMSRRSSGVSFFILGGSSCHTCLTLLPASIYLRPP